MRYNKRYVLLTLFTSITLFTTTYSMSPAEKQNQIQSAINQGNLSLAEQLYNQYSSVLSSKKKQEFGAILQAH